MATNRASFLIKNSALFAISSFATKFLSFFLVPVMTSVLTPVEYGTVDLFGVVRSLLWFILTMTISAAVLRFVMDDYSQSPQVMLIGIRIILGGACLLGIGLCLMYYFQVYSIEKSLYYFLFVGFITLSFSDLLSLYLRAKEQIKDVVISGLLSTIVNLLLSLLLVVVYRLGVNGLLFAMCIGEIASSVYSVWKSNIRIHFFDGARVEYQLLKDMLQYSIPLVFNGLVWWANGSIDKYFILTYFTLAQNGIYSVAGKIPSILVTLHVIFSESWSLLSIKECKSEDAVEYFSSMYKGYNAFLVLGSSILVLLNVVLAKFLYSKDFFIAWECSSILIFGVIFNALSSFLSGLFAAQKNTRILAISTCISVVFNAGLNYILVPKYNVIGAAIATAMAFIVMWACRLYVGRKLIHIKINLPLDFLAYMLLVGQIYLEHLPGHMYIAQICICCIIAFIYRRECKKIVNGLWIFAKGKIAV